MIYYSQRDSRWKDDRFGATTIGTHGCLITALAQLLLINGYDETPKTVNDKLRAVGGFTGPNNNLLIWGAIERVFEAKGHYAAAYNNDLVLDAIEKYGGCIVRVDASRIGASEHWVLYVGNGQMIDPWTGVLKATSYYPPTGCSIVEVVRKDTMDINVDIPSNVEEKFKLKDIGRYNKYWSYSELIQDWVVLVGKCEYEEAEKEKYKKEARELREVTQSQAESIAKLGEEIKRLDQANAEHRSEIAQLQEQFANVSRDRDSLLDCCKGYEITVPKLREKIKELEDKLMSQEPLKQYSNSELLSEVFNRFMEKLFKKGGE